MQTNSLSNLVWGNNPAESDPTPQLLHQFAGMVADHPDVAEIGPLGFEAVKQEEDFRLDFVGSGVLRLGKR
jgi:hypothetical protein